VTLTKMGTGGVLNCDDYLLEAYRKAYGRR
jgi:hypothetical protein